jgi:hypothetical protein
LHSFLLCQFLSSRWVLHFLPVWPAYLRAEVLRVNPVWPAAVPSSASIRMCGVFEFVTNSDHSVQRLLVILTTCLVSVYPQQIIKVKTLLRHLRFIWTALPTVIALNIYNTQYL